MPGVFGAQLYDLADPMTPVKSDGNQRIMNMTACAAGSCTAALNAEGRQELGCCWQGTNWTANNCTGPTGGKLHPCADVWNCTLPQPETGEYGSTCKQWSEADLLPSMRPVAKWLKLNTPSGIPGNQFMGNYTSNTTHGMLLIDCFCVFRLDSSTSEAPSGSPLGLRGRAHAQTAAAAAAAGTEWLGNEWQWRFHWTNNRGLSLHRHHCGAGWWHCVLHI